MILRPLKYTLIGFLFTSHLLVFYLLHICFYVFYCVSFFSANTIHQPLCRNFHDKIKKFTGRYAPFAIRSKNGRLSIAPPTDVLVHVSTTRGVHYFLITYEFGDEDICLWRTDGWRTRLPIRLVSAERDLRDQTNSCCTILLSKFPRQD